MHVIESMLNFEWFACLYKIDCHITSFKLESMKTIGLIGGMSWESSDLYYQNINRLVQKRCGGFNSAQIILYSVNFAEIEQRQKVGDWQTAALLLSNIACRLEMAGADAIALCTNTMHKVADDIQSHIKVPFLHIADSTIKRIHQLEVTKVALLGTRFTMQQSFLVDYFKHAGIEILLPDTVEQERIHHVIYDELCQGVIDVNSKNDFKLIIEKLSQKGAEGVILGCTEIGLLIQQQDIQIPVFDTTDLHVADIVNFILSDNQDSI